MIIVLRAGYPGHRGDRGHGQVLANGGHGHAVTHFAVFGYHVTGSTGTLGPVWHRRRGAGPGRAERAAGLRGRTSRRGHARRGLAVRRETAAVSADRDDLRGQRDTARAYTASTLGDGTAPNGTASTPGDDGAAPNGTEPGLRGPSLFERLFARLPVPRRPPRSQMR